VAVPLNTLEDFFPFSKRQADCNYIFDRIAAGNCLSLVGERRIGKTWLLQYIKLATPTELGERYRVAYLEMMSPECKSPLDFCTTAITGFELEPNSYPAGTKGLQKAVIRLKNQGHVPVLLLDEFDRLQQHPAFQLDFFEELRHIASINGLIIVTAGKQPLVDIIRQIDRSSPFFNIFMQREVGLLNINDPLRFMQEKSTKLAGFDESTINRLAEQAGPHPLRLQVAGNEWFSLQKELELNITHLAGKSLEPQEEGQTWNRFLGDYYRICEGFGLKVNWKESDEK